MKIFEKIKTDFKREFKLLGFSLMEQEMDYNTTTRIQRFLGNLVTTIKTKDYKTDNSAKEIRVLNHPVMERIDEDNFRKYILFGKIVKKISYIEKFKKENFKYFDKKYDDIYILRANSGEIYLTLTYVIDKLIERNQSKNPLLVATKKYHVDMIKMICPNIPFIYIKDIDLRFTGLEFKIENFRFFYLFDNPHFQKVGLDIKHKPFGEAHYFKSILDDLNMTYNDISMRTMIVPLQDEASMKEKVSKIGLNLDNFIFISPEAQSCKLYNEDFWCELINILNKEGYDVFVNRVTKDVNLEYATTFKSCNLTFAEAFALAKRAKRIISLRSGFTEFLIQTNTPMDVLYTKFRQRHSFDDLDITHVMSGFGLLTLPGINKDKIREFNMFEVAPSTCINCIIKGILNDDIN